MSSSPRAASSRVALGAVAMLLAATSLSGCGLASSVASASLPTGTRTAPSVPRPAADEIVRQAFASAKAASSVHLVVDYRKDGGGTTHLDISGQVDGSNQKGLILQPSNNFELLVVDGVTFVKVLDPLTAQHKGLPARAVGLYGPVEEEDKEQYAELLLAQTFSRLAGPTMEGSLSATKEALEDVTEQGRAAWKVVRSLKGDDVDVVVSADGKFELLAIRVNRIEGVAFSEWNAIKPFATPGKAEIFAP